MKERIQQLFHAIDKKDVDSFVSFLADDCRFAFGNNPAAEGKDATKETVSGFFSAIKGLTHSDLEFFEDKNAVIVKGNVTYTRRDDSQLTVPFCNVFRIENDLITEYLIYVDTSELFS